MNKKILIIGGVILSVIAGLFYTFWPKTGSGIMGGNINLSYQQGLSNMTMVDGKVGSFQTINGQRIFVPNDVELVSLVPKNTSPYDYLSQNGAPLIDSSTMTVKSKKGMIGSINFSEDPALKLSNMSAAGLGGGGFGIVPPYATVDSNSCVLTIIQLNTFKNNLSQNTFDYILNFVISRLYYVPEFATLSTKNKMSFATEMSNAMEQGIDIDAVKICDEIKKAIDSSSDNMIYSQCITTLKDVVASKNTDVDFILKKLKDGIQGFNAISSSGQSDLAVKVSNGLYNLFKNQTPFIPDYYCSLITNAVMGFFDDTDVFKQCIAVLKNIETYFQKSNAITASYIMSKLMDLPGFSYVATDIRNTIVNAIKSDLEANHIPINYELHCLNITSAIYNALQNNELFKQCVAIMTVISKLASPSVLDIETQLKNIEGFDLIASSKKASLINEILTDLKDGGDFNVNLHCFNIVTAILDAIGNSDVFEQCLTIMNEIATEYNKQNGTPSFDPVAFKTDVILTDLLKINSFNILDVQTKQKHVDNIYTDLADGGEFNKFKICSEITLDIFDVVSRTALYKQCIALMDQIYSSAKTDFSYIKSMLSTLSGFNLLDMTQQDSFTKDVQDDLKDGGDFNKEMHCFNIVSAILDNISKSPLYQQCIAILTDVYNDYKSNPKSYDQEFDFINTKLSGLNGFSNLSEAKRKELIDPIIADLKDGNQSFDKETHCLNIVTSIMDQIIDSSKNSKCQTDVASLITNGTYNDQTQATSTINKYFIDSPSFAISKVNQLTAYQSGTDITTFASQICSQDSGVLLLQSCVDFLQTTLLSKKTNVINASDKPGYVNGLFLTGVSGYTQNDSAVGLAIDYVLLDKGSAEAVCINAATNSTQEGTVDQSNAKICISVINDIYASDPSIVTDSFVLAKLNTLDAFTSKTPSIKTKILTVILQSMQQGLYTSPQTICDYIDSEVTTADTSDSSFIADAADDSSCKNIISNVVQSYSSYMNDISSVASTDPSIIEQNKINLQKTYILKILNEIDDPTHLVADTKKNYAASLLDIHVSDIGNTNSQRTVNVLHTNSRKIFSQNIFANLEAIKEFNGDAQRYVIKEIGKCDNPLRGPSYISQVFDFAYAKDKGVVQENTKLNNADYLLAFTRTRPYYQSCLDLFNSSTNTSSAEEIENNIKTNIAGASSSKVPAFVTKMALNMKCFYQKCTTDSTGSDSSCSQFSNINCAAKSAAATSICDELVSTIVQNVPTAEFASQDYTNYSVCEPIDNEFLGYKTTINASLKTIFLKHINAIASYNIAMQSSQTSASSNMVDSIQNVNAIKLHYILLSSLFNSVDTSAISIGSAVPYDVVMARINAKDINYQEFFLQYAELYGMTKQNGGDIIKIVADINQSEAYQSCISFVNSIAKSGTLQTDDVSMIKDIIGAGIYSSFTGYKYIPSASNATNYYNLASYTSLLYGDKVTSSTSDPCLAISRDIFNIFNANLAISGDMQIGEEGVDIERISVATIVTEMSKYISNQAKQNLTSSDLVESDVTFDTIIGVVSQEKDVEAARFNMTKITDFFNAGLSSLPLSTFNALSYAQKKQTINDTQDKIAKETQIAIDTFNAEGRQRVCKAVYDVWVLAIKNQGVVDNSKCIGVLTNAWSDGVCDTNFDATFKAVCGEEGPGLRRVSNGSYCLDTGDLSGMMMAQTLRNYETKRSFYQRQLPPPTNKCKCYLESMYNTTKNQKINTFDDCQNFVNGLKDVYEAYGRSVVDSPDRSACQLVFSSVKSIVNDDQYNVINANASSNDDYANIAAQICTQNLRDLHGLLEYTRASYWMETNISSVDGATLKESEYTKWGSVNSASFSSCESEGEVYI
jgi:hypothetical protein